jgi:hypothetical protein
MAGDDQHQLILPVDLITVLSILMAIVLMSLISCRLAQISPKTVI